MTNSNFNAQGTSSPVTGGYAQPSAGVTEAIVTPADPSGNAYVTSLASSGSANLQTANYRDSLVTVNAGGTAAAPGIGATIATITPGTAGLWEIYGTVGVAGATNTLADSNNVQLQQAASAKISPLCLPVGASVSSANAAIPATILNLGASDAVLVTAIRAATSGTTYSAALIARRVG